MFLGFLLSVFTLSSQSFQVSTKGEKLNILLNELVEKQNINLSFDEVVMSSIRLPKKQQFQNLPSFFSYLKTHNYIEIETIGNTFVLILSKQKNYIFQGKVFDQETKEPLPNAEIIFVNEHFYTSEQGYFTILAKEQTPKKIQVRYLGYQILDTLILAKSLAKIPLQSNSLELANITIKKKSKPFHINIGSHSGALKLTPEFVQKMPGYGESSMYSFLRLMPGVLATGESSNDISLRGSAEGQNLYLFDQCRVYQPWYRLNEIGTINPLLIQDIEVYKSGGDASLGENVGGMVLLKGKKAIPQRTKGEIFTNNFILNGKLEVPLSSRTAIIVAARKNLTEHIKIPDAVGEYTIKNTFDGFADNYQVTVNPRYQLYDGNLKIIHKIKDNSTLSVNAFVANEKNMLNATTLTKDFNLQNKQCRRSKQFATAINYENYNLDGKQLQITATFSQIQNTQNGLAKVLKLRKKRAKTYKIKNNQLSTLREFRMYVKRKIPFCKGGILSYGLGITASYIKEVKNTKSENWHTANWHRLGYGFVNAQYALSEKWNARIGGRLNYSSTLKKPSFEPRMELSFYPNEYWKLYSSYGIYQQFIYHANIIDKYKNVHYLRVNAEDKYPVYKLNSWCLGIRYAKKSWTIATELFYKYTKEQLQATTAQNLLKKQQLLTEKMLYMGGDLFVKYQKNGFISWLSFTLSDFGVKNNYNNDTSEDSSNDFLKMAFINENKLGYKHSEYDMRQELKSAIAYTKHNFTVSATYVYGSGFQMWHQPSSTGISDYQRFDIGSSYK